MRYGIKTAPQHCTWQDMLDIWRLADDIELFESAWNFDHFYPLIGDTHGPCLESWTMLAALAQATSRIRIGSMVNGMHYRHPAVTANMAATVDIISGGRLDLGMGAGWNLEESGVASAVMGNPINSVAWLARKLDEFGVTLQAGHTVLSGSFIRARSIGVGDSVVADYGPLGQISFGVID